MVAERVTRTRTEKAAAAMKMPKRECETRRGNRLYPKPGAEV